MEDFHHSSFFSPIDPVVFYGLGESQVNYFSMKVRPGKLFDIDGQLSQTWKSVNPNDVYERQFQAQVFDDFYRETESNITIVMFLSIVAIILACMGLYGLISFHIQAKLKEFSVRKVLGAAPRAIASIASKQYSWIILIAFAIGAPLGAWGIMQLINSVFNETKGLSLVPVIISLLIVMATLVLTVTGQVRRAINVNPATILRNE